jgi:hypothetical protein
MATSYLAKMAVGLSEVDQNQVTVADDVQSTQRMLLSRTRSRVSCQSLRRGILH